MYIYLSYIPQWICHIVSLCLCILGIIERWELLQAQALSKELRMKQNLQQWQQFNSDLNSIWTWLDQAEEELEQQRRLDASTDIHTIELRIKKLKVSHPKQPKLTAYKLWSISPSLSFVYSKISSLIVSLYSPGTTESCGQAESHSALHKPLQF